MHVKVTMQTTIDWYQEDADGSACGLCDDPCWHEQYKMIATVTGKGQKTGRLLSKRSRKMLVVCGSCVGEAKEMIRGTGD